MNPDVELPPQPIVTRWGSWINAALYYADNLDKIDKFLEKLDNKEASSIGKTKKIIKNQSLRNDMAFIKCHFSNIPIAIEKKN